MATASSCSQTDTPGLDRLRRRADFLAANAGARWSTPGFVLLARRHADAGLPRVGFTVTKRVGGAVVRNRLKRRLRAMAREALTATGLRGVDYVLIGRAEGLTRPYQTMKDELARGVTRVNSKLERTSEPPP